MRILQGISCMALLALSMIFVLTLLGCGETEESLPLSKADVEARLRDGPFPLVEKGQWEWRFEGQGQEDETTHMEMSSIGGGRYQCSFGDLNVLCFVYEQGEGVWDIRCYPSSTSLLAGILGPKGGQWTPIASDSSEDPSYSYVSPAYGVVGDNTSTDYMYRGMDYKSGGLLLRFSFKQDFEGMIMPGSQYRSNTIGSSVWGWKYTFGTTISKSTIYQYTQQHLQMKTTVADNQPVVTPLKVFEKSVYTRYEYTAYKYTGWKDIGSHFDEETEEWEVWFVRGVGIVKVRRTAGTDYKIASLVNYSIGW